MNCFCEEHGTYDSPKGGCPDCKKEEIRHIQSIVDNWGHSCPECSEKDALLEDMARVLEFIGREPASHECRTDREISWRNMAVSMLEKYRERKA